MTGVQTCALPICFPVTIDGCHGFPVEVPTPGDIVLTSLEVVIAGVGVDILPRLSQKQIDKIIDNLEL